MTQRIAGPTATYNDRPFVGDGASLYVNEPDAPKIRYRNLRIVGGGSRRRRRSGFIKGQGGTHDVAAASVLKTNRVSYVTSPTQFTDGDAWDIPVAYASSVLRGDVRIFADDVENQLSNFRTFVVELDANRDPVTAIHGTAKVIEQEQRAGGLVVLRLRYDRSRDGEQPDRFRLTRTAGPTSPADVLTSYVGTEQVIEIETGALSDASAYTFDIVAENSTTGTTATVVAGLQVTADATGPIAPINGSTSTK